MSANRDIVTESVTMGESNFTVREADHRDMERWNSFVDTTQGAEVYHRYEWRLLLEDVFGHRCHYLLAEDENERVIGVLPASEISSALFGTFFVSIPYFNYCGVLAESGVARNALIEHLCAIAEQTGADYVELRHRGSLDFDMPSRSDKVGMQLSLPADSDSLWKQLTSKLRAQIRRPQKAGATCREGGAELLDDFYSVFARNMRDLGTPVFPRAMFSKMLELFPETMRVLVVYLDRVPAAAGITIGYRGVVEIPMASSLREYNRQAVNMLLYWSVLESATRDQYHTFDFGRSTIGSGPHRFKKQWGAAPVTLAWHYWLRDGDELPQLNPSNPKFALATAVWRRLPVGVATLIGPKIIRYLA